MRFKKILPKDKNKWTKTCEALKELFETLHCSKCKNSLHDSQQFLPCGHFSCLSCTKNNNAKCIECQFSVNDDILKDDTIKKIVQACCTIAEQVGFNTELPSSTQNTSKEPPVRNQTSSSKSKLNGSSSSPSSDTLYSDEYPTESSNESGNTFQNTLKKREGAKVTKVNQKKAKLETVNQACRIPKIVDKKNHHGETRLQVACKKGQENYVKLLLEAGANPNTCCNANWTPLQECADFGFINIAKLLIYHGADVDKQGYEGRTPLHEATKADKLPMVQVLLKHNARTDIKDDFKNKPIHYCRSEAIKKLLIRDSTNSESEDDQIMNQARNSQNITIRHSQEMRHEPFDSEEIDILN